MKHTNNIYLVGNDIENIDDVTLSDTEKPLEGSLFNSLLEFKAFNNIHKLCLYPNFQYGCLSGPKGYAAQFHSDDPYYVDMFRCEKFRVITGVKLDMTADEWTTEQSRRFETIVRRCFPHHAVSSPLLTDTVRSGFGFDLSPKGSFIQLIEGKDINTNENKLMQYFYLVINDGPCEVHLHQMQEDDERLQRENIAFQSTYADGIKGTLNESVRFTTYGKAFEADGINDRMLQIQKEKNKRSLDYIARICGFTLKRESYYWTDGEGNEEYRIPSDLEELFGSKPATLFEKALQWWPKGALILPFTCLPIIPNEITKDQLSLYPDLPPAELSGYPLGVGVHTLYSAAKQDRFNDLRLKYDIKFETQPRTLRADFEVDYNTFRVDHRTGMITWYSNCTPVNECNGILSFKGLDLGFECLNYDISTDEAGEEWSNDMLNGYPVIYPFKPDNRKMPSDSGAKIFSLTAGGLALNVNNTPEQYQGLFVSVGSTDIPEVKGDLNITENIKKVLLIPLKVFISPQMINIPRFKILKN